MMIPLKLRILAGLAAAVLLGMVPQAPAQQRGGGNPTHQGMPADHTGDGHDVNRIYIRYYPYAQRHPHSGYLPGPMGGGFGQGYDYYGYLPAKPLSYPRLIVIPPPPPPPLPSPLT
jgi:hypothetical protein